jgi:ubiquinol-cytochrome c reductase iron-sulfur subunit
MAEDDREGKPLEVIDDGSHERPFVRAETALGSAESPVATPLDAPQLQIAAKHPRRAEITATVMFALGLLGFAGFGATYFQAMSTQWLGATLGVGMLCFGAGLVVWGKYLMPRGPFEEERKLMTVEPEQRSEIVADFVSRGRVAVERRSFIATAMALGGAVLGVVLAFPLLRSLGPRPANQLFGTKWKKGSYLTTITNQRVHVDDLAVGGILTVFPEDDVGGPVSQSVLIRLAPSGWAPTTLSYRKHWGPDGYVAFSKVCTHAGCPVNLWEHELEKLVCPCHQSMFYIPDAATPIFGPAPRPLPQLPLYVDSQGYLRAQAGFDEPVGPGFWSRGAGPAS